MIKFLKIFTFKRLLIFNFVFMFLLAGLWLLQTSLLARETERLSQAQFRLAELENLRVAGFSDLNLEVEKLAQNYNFEKIDDVYYIKANANTALAK